jgi:hypothetical protein
MVFQMRILPGVGLIGSPLLGLASFWVLLWCLWTFRKQSSVAQSTTEAEYVAAASCCSQLLWISYTMSDFGEEYTHVPLQCDSTSAISIAKNPMLHSKTKHIEVRYHFLRDNVENGKIALIHVPTHDQLADIFIKPLDQATFTRLQGELGVCLIS